MLLKLVRPSILVIQSQGLRSPRQREKIQKGEHTKWEKERGVEAEKVYRGQL